MLFIWNIIQSLWGYLHRYIPYGLRLQQRLQHRSRLRLCLSTSHTDCVESDLTSGKSPVLCLSTYHTDCVWRSTASEMVCKLCLSTSHTDCVGKYAQKHPFFCETYCELVDSFSGTQTFVPALAIFPNSFAAKATYVAINDSLGRTIDRFAVRTTPVFSVSLSFSGFPCSLRSLVS